MPALAAGLLLTGCGLSMRQAPAASVSAPAAGRTRTGGTTPSAPETRPHASSATVGQAPGAREAGSDASADSDRRPALPPVWVHFVDGQTAWGIDPAAVLRSDDAGRTWVAVTPPGLARGAQLQDGYFLGPSVGWLPYAAQGTGGGLIHTANGGRTWDALPFPGDSLLPQTARLDFVDDLHGWLMASPGATMTGEAVEIFQTADGGASWKRIAESAASDPSPVGDLPNVGDKATLTFISTRIGWVTGSSPENDPYLFRTADGGHTWQQQALPGNASINPAHMAVVGVDAPVFGAGDDGVLAVRALADGADPDSATILLYDTGDGGATWTLGHVLASPTPAYVTFSTPRTGVAGYRDHTTDITHDGGATWLAVTLPGAPPPGAQAQVAFADDEDGFAWQGTHLWSTRDGGSTWSRASMTLQSAPPTTTAP